MSIKLLIAEKIPGSWLDFEKELLKSNSLYEITHVSSISEVKEYLKDPSYEAVVTDYFLTDGVCIDLIGAFKQLPFIVMISEGDEEAALVSLKAGAADYLIKDARKKYQKFLPLRISRSLDLKNQADELQKYRSQLENVVEERTIELIEMYSKLQESETNFRNIFNSSTEGIIIIDYDYKFVEANESILKQFGVDKQFLASHELINYLAPDYKKAVLERMDQVKKGHPTGNAEIEVISPSTGIIIPYEVSTVPIIFNQKNALLSILHDITERKSHARKLFETIIQTEEEERKRIASDLHDEIGPLISALKIFTTSFIESTSEEKKTKLARKLGSIVREVIDSIKTISNDMSPHVLINFGLLAAIQNFIDLFSKNIDICLNSNIEKLRFPDTVESLIYRILKELINNTVKHARATRINISIEYINNQLICNYMDDGIGFNWDQHVELPAKGMGINNIITRIRSMGGDFQVHSEHEKGFEITFELETIAKDANNKKEIQSYNRG
jgi:PAS domain S-box-containing protein